MPRVEPQNIWDRGRFYAALDTHTKVNRIPARHCDAAARDVMMKLLEIVAPAGNA